jgi:hypothetical protein
VRVCVCVCVCVCERERERERERHTLVCFVFPETQTSFCLQILARNSLSNMLPPLITPQWWHVLWIFLLSQTLKSAVSNRVLGSLFRNPGPSTPLLSTTLLILSFRWGTWLVFSDSLVCCTCDSRHGLCHLYLIWQCSSSTGLWLYSVLVWLSIYVPTLISPLISERKREDIFLLCHLKM